MHVRPHRSPCEHRTSARGFGQSAGPRSSLSGALTRSPRLFAGQILVNFLAIVSPTAFGNRSTVEDSQHEQGHAQPNSREDPNQRNGPKRLHPASLGMDNPSSLQTRPLCPECRGPEPRQAPTSLRAAATMWRADMPAASSSSWGLPEAGSPWTASRTPWSSGVSGPASAWSTAEPMPPSG